MRLRKNVIVFLLTGVIVFAISSCKKDKDEEVLPEDSFDKSEMLANIGDNLILPAYAKLKLSMDSLQLSNNLFTANPTLLTLTELQAKFTQAYINYQWCSTYEFGPAESEVVRANFNTFPCDTIQINSNISSGIYDLASAANIDAKGLPAIDFLLYRSNQDNNYILSLFTTSISASNAKNYLTALVNELKIKTDAVNTAWSSTGGNYINTFKSSTGSDVGGSIGMLVNQLNYDFELLKNAKIGIPLGKKTLGVALPEKVEAYYSTQSIALVLEHIKSIENIYLGRDIQNSDGLGLDDYLDHVGAQYGSGSLNNAIKNKLTTAKTKLIAIPGTLSQAVIANTTIVDNAYAELQQLVILLKVDMPSSLGVLITYVDSDGD